MKTLKMKHAVGIMMIALTMIVAAEQVGAAILPPAPRPKPYPENPDLFSGGRYWLTIDRGSLWDVAIHLVV